MCVFCVSGVAWSRLFAAAPVDSTGSEAQRRAAPHRISPDHVSTSNPVEKRERELESWKLSRRSGVARDLSLIHI